jgi:hypothetical protein
MNNVEINNIRDDSKSSLYYNDCEIENNIGSALSSIEPSLSSQLSLLSVSKVNKTNVYHLENRHMYSCRSFKQR